MTEDELREVLSTGDATLGVRLTPAGLETVKTVPVAEWLKLESEVRELKRVVEIETRRRQILVGELREFFRETTLVALHAIPPSPRERLYRLDSLIRELESKEGV